MESLKQASCRLFPNITNGMASSRLAREKAKQRASLQQQQSNGSAANGVAGSRKFGSTTSPPPSSAGNGIAASYAREDFEFLSTIGTGTFGRVLLCRERHSHDYFAMKVLPMSEVIRLKQVQHVKNEKNILLESNHPFIVRLYWTSHDSLCLYMLLEYVPGGELFSYLRNAGRFSITTAMFYSAEIILALEYLHKRSIVYRDLKPENLLLDREGHLKITDFGFAKKLDDRTWTLCGTPEYLAPEIIQSKGHNRAVDWWALGILLFEMLAGYPPFFDDNPFGIYQKILQGKVEWPRHFDPHAKDLVRKLLHNDRTKRLGSMKYGADDVKKHKWYRPIGWDDILHKRCKPPLVPRVAYDGDTKNFDDYSENKFKRALPVQDCDLKMFNDF